MSGRFRQFFQFGIENFGSNSAVSDAECIAVGALALEKLDLHKNTILREYWRSFLIGSFPTFLLIFLIVLIEIHVLASY